jgi:hypothetical protein
MRLDMNGQCMCDACYERSRHVAPPQPMLLAVDERRRDRWRKEQGTAERRAWVTA